jgi:hypothetical protein
LKITILTIPTIPTIAVKSGPVSSIGLRYGQSWGEGGDFILKGCRQINK